MIVFVGLCLLVGLMAAGPVSAATVTCTGVAAWVDCCGCSYSAGQQVTFGSPASRYHAAQTFTNTCGAGWNPAAVQALWTLDGSCGSATPTATSTGPTPTRAPTATATATTVRATATATTTSTGICAAAWVSSVQYCAGAKVSVSGNNYTAAFCSQGSNPTTNNGPSGSGQPWLPPQPCTAATATSTTPPTPTPTTCTGCTAGTARSAPYVDISLATGSQVAANVSAAGLPGVTLAFLVDGGCTATWAGGLGNVSSAMFPNGTSVASQISALTGAGKKVIISWGGANGSIQSSCTTASQVQAMYQQAFTAYPSISGLDFDIEGGINDTVVAQALAGLKAANPSKSISLTLPVLPTGLVTAGLNIVNACHSAGFHPDTVNVMAMDYGSAVDNGGNMLLDAQQAAQSTRTQTGDNIGVTPMIGQNDTSGEIFTISNASAFISWAKGQSYINRVAFWSLSRDNGGCAGQTSASPTCSGVSQSTWQFSGIFAGF
jgi:chitinase